DERRARRAGTALARLEPVAHGRVVAGRPVRHGGRLAAGRWVAGVRRAGVAVVADERRPRGAGARLAGLDTVADVTVRARGTVRHGRRDAARGRRTRVDRAD